ncbi:MAG: hypothetical protein H8E37_04025 [Planctomycetes bacterium]|nr:hypothetical protein [Planctomycetota bacterium]
MPTLFGVFMCRLVTILFLLSLARFGISADWPHWRGLKRNGVSTEPSGWTGGEWPGKQFWDAKTPPG